MDVPVCTECSGAMEEGFILDRGHFDSRHVPSWVGGPPERSFWSGLKTTGKPAHEVVTYRCVQCGLLRSYARLALQ
jgi:hypothetical protein